MIEAFKQMAELTPQIFMLLPVVPLLGAAIFKCSGGIRAINVETQDMGYSYPAGTPNSVATMSADGSEVMAPSGSNVTISLSDGNVLEVHDWKQGKNWKHPKESNTMVFKRKDGIKVGSVNLFRQREEVYVTNGVTGTHYQTSSVMPK